MLYVIMKKFLDKFSKQAATYKKFRPTYPSQLFDFINSQCPDKNMAWDCGTGNGQVAAILAESFKNVYATDISENQIQNAIQKPNISYAVERSEMTSLPNKSIDLLTVAQAIHWFDFDVFYNEAKRVLKPNGTLAIWGYGLLRINASINKIIDNFYTNEIGPYWNKERRHIDNNYESIPFNFDPIKTTEKFKIETNWTLNQLEGYFNSWSSVQNYIETHQGRNPVNRLIKDIALEWDTDLKTIHFPIFIKIGKCIVNTNGPNQFIL